MRWLKFARRREAEIENLGDVERRELKAAANTSIRDPERISHLQIRRIATLANLLVVYKTS